MNDIENEQDSTWSRYYEATKNKPPSPLLFKALQNISHPGNALDLGCGAMNDTRELLARGFRVTAVDSNPRFQLFAQKIANENLTYLIATFLDVAYDSYDLVNAQFSLPFNPPETFDEVIKRLFASIIPRGIFVGQLFGIHDSWNTPENRMTFHTEEQIIDLLKLNSMNLLEFENIEDDEPAVSGLKHWHYYNILAQKQ